MRASTEGAQPIGRSQIGSSHVSNEQRIAGEHRVRMGSVFLQVEHQNRDGFDRVARCFENLELDAAERQDLAVRHRREGIFRACLGAKVNGRASAMAQLEVAGEEVSVKVREKYPADVEPVPRGRFDVEIDVTLRIDDDGDPAARIADEIRGVRQTPQIELFEDHNPKILVHAARRSRKVKG